MAKAKTAVKEAAAVEEVQVKYDKPAKNPANYHKVPVKQWKKWSLRARFIFNSVFLGMTADQQIFMHPMGARQSEECWKTTAWNAAWQAASACDYFEE